MENHEERISRREKAAKIRRRRQREKRRILIIGVALLVVIIVLIAVIAGKKDGSTDNDVEVKDITVDAKEVDTTELKNLIEKTKAFKLDGYTKKSVTALKDSVEAAEKLLEGNPKEREIEEAYFDILDSMYDLKIKKESSKESSKDTKEESKKESSKDSE